MTHDLEMLTIHLVARPDCRKIIYTCIYRPPSGKVPPFIEILDDFLETTDGNTHDIFIGGDFNIDFSKKEENETISLVNLAGSHNLEVLIDTCTRMGTTRLSHLDNILSNAEHIIFKQTVPVYISDHLPVVCVKKKEKTRPTTHIFIGRSYHNFNKGEFQRELLAYNWDLFYIEKNPEWAIIEKRIIRYLDRRCPLREFKIKGTDASWMTGEIKELIAEKSRRILSYARHKHPADLTESNRLRSLICRMRKDIKKQEVDEAFRDNKNGHQQFWKKIAELIKPDKSNSSADFLHHETGQKVPPEESADYFNEFFATVGEKMCNNINFDINNSQVGEAPIETPCTDLVIEEECIRKLVNKIKTTKSSGIEGINARVLKDALTVLVTQLCDVFRNSLSEGIFPDSWSVSTVVPIPKAGSLNEISNWRPINLLPVPGRLLEKVVHGHILNHLHINALLSKAQYGFRPGLGTGDAIFDFINYVYEEMDKDKFVSTCFVDGSKAFDSVHHSLLLKKCTALKINNQTVTWLKSYLGNRRQVTTLNGHKSKECKVSFGVPQGSTLGPLLFLLFINDFPNRIRKSKVYMYADDIVLVASGNSYEESANSLSTDVALTDQWCKTNCLTINKKKTKVMRITRNRVGGAIPALDIYIDNNKLEDVKEYRYLGITVNHRFTFKPHVTGLTRTVSYRISLLGRIKKYMEELQAFLVYKTMIVPYFNYANFALECTTEDLVKKLQKLQNRGLRVCRYSNMFERSSATALHDHFDIKFLDHRRYTQLLLMMYKQSKSKGMVIPVEERRTRGDHKVKFKKGRFPNRFCSTDKSPWHRGVIAWDKLPPEFQKIETKAEFKFKVKGIPPPKLYR